jgi:ribonuclease HI
VKNKTVVFSDGASRGNPGSGGWGAVLVAGDKVSELGGREKNTTNNRMELTAAIEALKFLKNSNNKREVTVYTDSEYLVKGITNWIYSWEKRNWMTKNKEPVLNKDLWEALLELVRFVDVDWQRVSGHAGVPGNERADEIATSFADLPAVSATQAGGLNPDLYSGSISKYGIKNILDLNIQKKLGKNVKAYSYLSLVNGEVKKHKTWKECEERVKGKSGVKFKKAMSAEEEKKILKEWQRLSK